MKVFILVDHWDCDSDRYDDSRSNFCGVFATRWEAFARQKDIVSDLDNVDYEQAFTIIEKDL